MTEGLLNKTFYEATDNRRYSWGIKVFVKAISKNVKFSNNPKIISRLGLLYDHLALSGVNKSSRLRLEQEAVKLYRKALKINPKFVPAIWGIGRVWWHRKSKRAIPYALRAYKMAKQLRLPRAIYAQNVGLSYEAIGSYQNAEKWFLRGLKEKSKKDDWGVYVNLLSFYKRKGEQLKSKEYAQLLAVGIKKEPAKFKKSVWGKNLKKLIESA